MRASVRRFTMVCWSVGSLATGLLVACGARTPLDESRSDADQTGRLDASTRGTDTARDAARDAPVEPPRDASSDAVVLDPICVWPAGGLSDGACQRSLRAGLVSLSAPTCVVDAVVHAGDVGVLQYDCGGGGAVVRFGSHEFRGSFDGDRIDVCIGTEFDWSDGCHWHSAQRIQGNLSESGLRFDYVESPDPGQTGCTWSCSATAKLPLTSR